MLLILGAGGFIGTAIARRAAELDLGEVHCLVRRPTPELEAYGKVHIGDARRPQLGLDRDEAAYLAAETTQLILTMGRVSFGMSLTDARSNHLGPLQAALHFARTCKKLDSIVYVSSIAAIGDCKHRVRSDELPNPIKLRNFYEWAKYEGERLVRGFPKPVRIVRPGQVMNSFDDTQKTREPLVMFEAFPYLASGRPLVTGGNMDYWCGPVDFVADVTVAVARSDRHVPGVWAIDPNSPGLHEILDVVAMRHGLGAPRYVNKKVAKAVSSLVKPEWLGLENVSREVLPYTHATYDLDLSCIKRMAEAGEVTLPADRSYVTRTIDHEIERLRSLQ
jgi:nucleoside-diphosphate-sugar epimerase